MAPKAAKPTREERIRHYGCLQLHSARHAQSRAESDRVALERRAIAKRGGGDLAARTVIRDSLFGAHEEATLRAVGSLGVA